MGPGLNSARIRKLEEDVPFKLLFFITILLCAEAYVTDQGIPPLLIATVKFIRYLTTILIQKTSFVI